jgi:hypothetical protein
MAYRWEGVSLPRQIEVAVFPLLKLRALSVADFLLFPFCSKARFFVTRLAFFGRCHLHPDPILYV